MKGLGLIFLLLLISCAHVVRAQSQGYAALPGHPFVYVSSDMNAVVPTISDSLFNASARGVRFQVNRTELRPHDPFVTLYKKQIAPLLRDKGLVLRHIIVKGAASPEGPYDNNCRLSRERTQQLIAFLSSQLGGNFDTSRIEYDSICEDYEYLVTLMNEAHDAEAAEVARIWQESGQSEPVCKQKLMSLKGGSTWRRLLKEYFPSLRQARIMLFFGRVPDPVQKLELSDAEWPAFGLGLLPELGELPAWDLNNIVVGTPIAGLDVPKVVKGVRLPLIAVRTNLVHDFFYMPNFGFAPSGNIQLEYFPRSGRFTYNVGFSFSNHRHYGESKFFQIRDVQLEMRRYFRKGHPYRGAYLAAYAHGFAYGIGFGPQKGWEGEGLGGGLSAGYTVKLSRDGHFRLEAMASFGAFTTKYDPYVWGNPITGEADGKYYYDYKGTASKFKKRNRVFTWMGPTNLGVQLTYDLIYRKREKGGQL